MDRLTVGFAGMTHLGTCSSVAASLKGNNIVAFDFDNELISQRKHGKFNNAEPGIENFLQEVPDNYSLTNQLHELKKCDLVFVSVDTSVDSKGNVNTNQVEKLYSEVAKTINSEIPIIILSQVRPGFTRSISRDRSETYYQMETLIFGQGLTRALEPERYVVGLSNEARSINTKYEEFLKQGNCPILKLTLESAELTKLSVNFMLATAITSTNTLASLSSKLGANWTQVSEALKLDRRIGPYAYLNPGLGIGGTNIIRDLIGIREMSIEAGLESSIIDAMLLNSKYSVNWLSRKLIEIIPFVKSPRIGILGLSYKSNTDSTIGSSGVKTARIFSKKFPVFLYDPVVKSHPSLEKSVVWCDTFEEVISEVNILIIATKWKDFKEQSLTEYILKSRIKYLIDPFDCQIDRLGIGTGIGFCKLGN